MKRKKTGEFWMIESRKQQERLVKLYGPGEYGQVVGKVIKQNKKLYIVLAGLLFSLFFLTLFQTSADGHWIQLNKQGNLTSITRPNSNSPLVIEAEVVSEKGISLTPQGVRLVVSPQSAASEAKESMDQQTDEAEDMLKHEIRKTVYQINNDSNSEQIVLPDQLSDGTRVRWIPKRKQTGVVLIAVFAIAVVCLYQSRDAALKRMERDAKESVLRDLPEFVNKLVLLLNAGLVMRTAIQHVVSEHNKRTDGAKDYFYSQLTQIMMKCNKTNSSIQVEIRMFAVRTGIVEFMRLSNIMNDSLIKGSDLVSQLKMEGDNLWTARRKQMEEKGKIAESKLTFPLLILLLVLVMITIAPAMMEMQ